MLGTITAVGGGAVRDIVLRRIPAVLGGNTLYATCAAVASAVLVVLYDQGYATVGTLAALVVGAGLCLLARWRGWILPSGDDWSPLRVVPATYRILHRGRREDNEDPTWTTTPKKRTADELQFCD